MDLGGLLAYGVDYMALDRHAVSYDRILKGTLPGEIPFYRATEFELVINLKTAKALGMGLSQSL